MKEMKRKLSRLINKEKIYLKTPLKKQKEYVSRQLNLTCVKLDRLVKAAWNKNFKELMYEKRIDEAKTLLADIERLDTTILSIAFEAGFENINTFNIKFKKYTGMTPTEYRAFHVHFKRITGVKPEDFESF